jgi:hypothetical protein
MKSSGARPTLTPSSIASSTTPIASRSMARACEKPKEKRSPLDALNTNPHLQPMTQKGSS